jgi:hypothetical protein
MRNIIFLFDVFLSEKKQKYIFDYPSKIYNFFDIEIYYLFIYFFQLKKLEIRNIFKIFLEISKI